jgi:hypothetical protein
MRVDSSGNVGIGTSSPNGIRLNVDSAALNTSTAYIKNNGALPDNNDNSALYVNHAGTTGTGFRVRTDQALTGSNFAHVFINNVSAGINGLQVSQYGTGWIASFDKSGTVAMRIDNSGNVLVGTSSTLPVNLASGKFQVLQTSTSGHGASFKTNATSGFAAAAFSRNGNNGSVCEFGYDTSTTVGSISVTSTATTYNTSSDYRLKESIAPMTGALGKVAALKPVTYKWKSDGSDGEGFIAHELAEVCPHAVTGEKDAVDEDGNPVYQGIDTSFLVATLTAAIQELKAEFDAYKATHP